MKKGVLFALTAALISGVSIFYNRLIIVRGIDPSIFNILKNGGVAFILSLIILITPNRKQFASLSRRSWMKLFAIAVIGGSIPFLLYFEGLRSVAATNANLINKTMFVWTAVLAIPILGESVNLWQTLGYLLVIWSNFFIGGLKGFTGSPGELMILAATLMWALENIIAKFALRNIDAEIAVWGRMTLGILIIFAVTTVQGKLNLFMNLSLGQIIPIAGSIILLTGYVISWYKALKFAPATLVTSILVIATPITNFLSALFITRSLPQIQLNNIILTSIGVGLIAIFSLRKGSKTSAINI